MIGNKRQQQDRPLPVAGRLLAKPVQPSDTTLNNKTELGLQPLNLAGDRDGLLYIPAQYNPTQPAPLVLMLHGAGGNARNGLAPFLLLADEFGLILLAVDSHRKTWDLISGQYGTDIGLINQALSHTFARYRVNPAHVAIEGFSDGASYALSVGLTNGDLFTHIIAFSPGFMAPAGQLGLPRLFISHGEDDNVLLINRCSRRIVPQVQRAGYDVLYREFKGGHSVPTAIAHEALNWFVTEPTQNRIFN